MKRKLVTLLLALSIATISITACGHKTTGDIEINTETTESSSETEMVAEIESLPWLQLGELKTHPELREAVDKQLGIVVDNNGIKEGILYIDTKTLDNTNNSTLFMAMQNTAFAVTILGKEEALESLGNIAVEHYTDVEAGDMSSAYATINAYFELLPDVEEGIFDGDATISRAQAMTLVTRATTPVNEAQAPEVNADFTSKVGETKYTNFAAPMNEFAYINTSNGLNAKTFDGTMTRGEYISLLMNLIFADYEGEIPEVELTTLKDAGDINFATAINDASQGVPSDMYNVLKKAVALSIVDENSLEWDSALTKSDAIELFVKVNKVHNDLVGYAISADESFGSGYTVLENGGYTYDGSKDMDGGYDKESWLGSQWVKNEACKLAGCESMQEFIRAYAPGRDYGEAWRAYAQQNGADDVDGSCWIYYHGKAAGNEPSYAINKMTGEKIVAGPHAMLPGGLNFWGYGAEYETNSNEYILSQ